MQTLRNIFASLVLLSLLVAGLPLLTQTAIAASAPPTILSYQGRLTDSGGNLVGGAGTTYYFKFSLWDSATVGAGNKVWPVSQPATTTATVRQGVFNVDIGDTASGYPDVLNINFANYPQLYLQVDVSADNNSSETLTPRQRLTSNIYAQVAGSVVGTTTASTFGTTTSANSFVTIAATSSNTTGLTIVGAQSQSANLLQIQSNTFQNIFSVSAGGLVSAAALSLTSGATTTALAVTGSTTVAGLFNSVGANLLASTTLLGNSLLSNATTTNFAISGVTSSLLKTLSNGAIVAAQAGTDYLTASFLPQTPFPSNATTTALTFGSGLVSNGSTTIVNLGSGFVGSNNGKLYSFASSTITAASSTLFGDTNTFTGKNTFAQATTTSFAITGITSALLKTLSGGALVAAVAGTDYQAAGNFLASSSISAQYPLVFNSGTGVFTSAFSTTTTNTFSSLNTFTAGILTNASSTFGNFTANFATTSQATTTSFAITNISSQLLKTLSNGAVVAAISGTDYAPAGNYATFGYLFPNNATSTTLTFGNGLVSNGSTTIVNLGSGFVGSSNGLLYSFASSSITAASSTLLANVNTWTGPNAFNGGAIFSNASFGKTGTTTITTAGFLGIGSSTPFANLSLHALFGGTNTTLFAIGSSTASATSTLFSVSNTGAAYLSTAISVGTTTSQNGLFIVGTTTLQPNVSVSWNQAAEPLSSTLRVAANGAAQSGLLIHGSNTGVGNTHYLSIFNSAGTQLFDVDDTVGVSIGGSNRLTVPGLISGAAVNPTGVTDPNIVGSNLAAMGAEVLWDQTQSVAGVSARTTPLLRFSINPGAGNSPTLAGSTGGISTVWGSTSSSTGLTFSSYSTSTSSFVENFRILANGNTGFGSTSPYAKFAIHANNGDSATSLFAIGSSTINSTSTLFSISNTGSTTIANGVNITSGCYAVNGNCLATAGSAASSTLLANVNTWTGLNNFNGGFTTTGATSTGTLAVTGSTTIANLLNVAGTLTSGNAVHNGTLFVTGSTTLANLFAINATTSQATTTSFAITGTANTILKTLANGAVVPAISGTDYAPAGNYANFSYLFPNNATTTGLGIFASSTIGNGSQQGGLTISGGATTTGQSFFSGYVGIGSTSPTSQLTVTNPGFTGNVFTVVMTNDTGNSAFGLTLPLSTDVNTGKAFSINVPGEGSGRVMFYSDGKIGIGPGSATRDTYISRSAANTFRISSDGASGAGNLLVNGSTTVAGQFNAVGGATFGTITSGNTVHNGTLFVTGSTTLANFVALNATTSQATTTNFAITGITSALLKTLSNGALVAAVAGADYSNFAYPFLATGNATGTLTQFNAGLTAYASSTIGNGSQQGGLTISGGATTTGSMNVVGKFGVNDSSTDFQMEIGNTTGFGYFGISSAWGNNVVDGDIFSVNNAGNVGIGTTSAFARFAIQATSTNGVNSPTILFAIASSTAGNATTTLFSVSNTGSTTISNGVNITSGCYAIGGNCLATGGSTASSTLLSDINTFTNLQTLTRGLNVSGTSNQFLVDGVVTGYASSTNWATNFGYAAGGQISTTSSAITRNSAFGFLALSAAQVGGTSNSAFGARALQLNTTGSSNAAFGSDAMNILSTGNSNTSIGAATAQFLTIGNNNTFLGSNAGGNTVSGSRNIAIGSFALGGNGGGFTGSGGSNIAIGYQALLSNDTGSSSIAIGSAAGGNAGIASSSIFIGFRSGLGGGAYNNQGTVALGSLTGTGFINGSDYNTLMGFGAGASISSGARNILIGPSETVSNLTTGFENIGIGNNIFFPTAATNQFLNIGNLIFGTLPATSSAFKLPTSGSVGIGSSSPFAKFSIHANNGDTATTLFAIGSSTANSTTTLFSIMSNGKVASNVANNLDNVFTIATSSTNIPIFSVSTVNSAVGKVGIGSSTPWGKFSLEMGPHNPAFVVANQGSTSPAFMVGGVNQNGNVGIGTSTPFAKLSIMQNIGDSSGTLFAIGSSTGANPTTLFSIMSNGRVSSNIPNNQDNIFTIATSSTNVPIFSISTRNSPVGKVGIGTSSPWGKLAVEMGNLNPSFVISNQGSSTPAFFVSGVNQNGMVGIGTSSNSIATTSALVVGSSAASGRTIAAFYNAGGAAYISNTSISFTSDQRLKKNITSIGANALNGVLALQAVMYNFNSEQDGTPLHTGFLAQQAQPIFPDLVETNSQGYLSFNYGGLTPYLASAIQAQQLEILSIASSTATTTQIFITNQNVFLGFASTTATSSPAFSVWNATATTSASIVVNGNFYINGKDIGSTVASSTATTTATELVNGPFSLASSALRTALSDAFSTLGSLTQSGVRELGVALHATIGVFDKVFAREMHTDKLCVGETCVSQAQFLAMVQASGGNGGSSGGGSGTGSGGSGAGNTTPPTITINGNNPATISVGDTYNDLGATAVDVEGHDLTVHTFVNGTLLEPVVLDTSATATDTIDYVATDTWGNTATSTRTVIIQ